VLYCRNHGRYQRDAKATGIRYATSDYLGFLDDDVIIPDQRFFENLYPLLNESRVLQVKVVLENLHKTNEASERWPDRLSTRPYPVLEFPGVNFNTGSRPRAIYPLIEFGNFWPKKFASHFIDTNLINDAYGESYASALKLFRLNIPIVFNPALVITHPGAESGGSHRFNKKTLLRDFTPFHEGYFYNMVYLHARYFPAWIWLWLPYYTSKIIIGWLANRNTRGMIRYGCKPLFTSLKRHWFLRSLAPKRN
jgi:glycosyltransferase involved in cell wall biosynthesis